MFAQFDVVRSEAVSYRNCTVTAREMVNCADETDRHFDVMVIDDTGFETEYVGSYRSMEKAIEAGREWADDILDTIND